MKRIYYYPADYNIKVDKEFVFTTVISHKGNLYTFIITDISGCTNEHAHIFNKLYGGTLVYRYHRFA